MAVALLGMLASGVLMVNGVGWGILTPYQQFNVYQIHKAVGVLLLGAVVLRLVLALVLLRPALPRTLPQWEQRAARLGHLLLYAVMLALPVSGWVMVSSSPYGLPTLVFDVFTWPHLPGIAGDVLVNGWSKMMHEILGYTLMGLLCVHIGAVAKHAMRDKLNLIPRMWFTTSRRGTE